MGAFSTSPPTASTCRRAILFRAPRIDLRIWEKLCNNNPIHAEFHSFFEVNQRRTIQVTSKLRIVVLAAGLVSLFSCVSVRNWESNKAPDYSQKASKLYIFLEVGDWKVAKSAIVKGKTRSGDPQYGWVEIPLDQYLRNDLSDAFAESAIPVDFTVLGGLELDNAKLIEAVKTFGAKSYLAIQITRLESSTYNSVTSVTASLEASIIDMDLNRRVWRARYKVFSLGGEDFGASDIDNMVKSLMVAMQKDGLY